VLRSALGGTLWGLWRGGLDLGPGGWAGLVWELLFGMWVPGRKIVVWVVSDLMVPSEGQIRV